MADFAKAGARGGERLTGARTAGYLGTLISACSAVFVAQSCSALPASLNGMFQQELHAQGSGLTWITSAFMVAVVVFEFTFGVLGDLFGRKKLVIAGALTAIAGCIVCATAPSVHVLWAGAALAGLGAGALFPGSLTMVAATTRNAAQRARGIAIWAGTLSLACGIAPLIGGLFADDGSWRGAYWVVAAIAALSLVLTAAAATESSAPEGRRLDIPGQVTFAVGLIAVLFGAIQGPADGWGSTRVVVSFIVGAVLLAVFVAIESRAKSPILHLFLFKDRAFAVTAVASVLGMFAFLGVGYALSIWMGPIQHQKALDTAVVFLVMQVPAFVLSPLFARLVYKVSPVWLLTGGFLVIGIGSLTGAGLSVTDNSLVPVSVTGLIVGLGFGLALSSLTAVAINTVPRPLAGMASATINMIRDLGFALGPVIVGAVALSRAGSVFMKALPTSGLPADQLGPAMGIGKAAGPIAVNSLLPGSPGSAAHGVALASLGSGFHVAFAVCGIAAIVAAVACAAGLTGIKKSQPADAEDGITAQAPVAPVAPAH